MNWGLIIGMAALAIWTGHWPAYVLAIVVIATRQHALGILMHDGTHYRCSLTLAQRCGERHPLCALPVACSPRATT